MWQPRSPLLSPGGWSSESWTWLHPPPSCGTRSHRVQTEGGGHSTLGPDPMTIPGVMTYFFIRLPLPPATCHPTLSHDRERIHYKSTPQPISHTPTQTPGSNRLHPVIRQINDRAWNVAFALTKVKCCREGVAFGLWLVDYAPRNPLNAGIIWWSCQFAVCALSLPHFLFLLPQNQSRLCCTTSEEDLKFGEAEIHVGRRDEQPQKLPGIPTSPELKIRVLMSLRNLCLDLHNTLWVKGKSTTGVYAETEN